MNVLVACERSGVVRQAFRQAGHNAWSCDLAEAEDGSPYHFQQDAVAAIQGRYLIADDSPDPLWPPFAASAIEPNGDQVDAVDAAGDWDCFPAESARPIAWDLIIAHPPCTHLSASGARWWPAKRASGEQQAALAFVRAIVRACIASGARWAVENPIGILSAQFRPPDQIIQPHQFGHDASKATCLWLGRLPCLRPTQSIAPRIVAGRKRWGNQLDTGQNRQPDSKGRAMIRSRTYDGIAAAMASQWGALQSPA